ncbi:hypothetical protein [Halomicrococcus sp. NG-SE-24]|uniref:hypothetical protein n=1 Tax=Halomicrococcus sp. NG-SE-24 TaxID=3436928 RepID=UPI003D95E447
MSNNTISSGVDHRQSDCDESQTESTPDDQDQLPHQDPDRLQEVYEQVGTIAATATYFDISAMTARTWLIRHDIFDPDTDGLEMSAQQLQELDPEDVGLPPRGER